MLVQFDLVDNRSVDTLYNSRIFGTIQNSYFDFRMN